MKARRNTISGSISINRGLIQAIPTSLPPQPIGEATKASNLQRIPPGVQGRSHFTYFLYLIVQNMNTIFLDYRVTLGFGSTGGLDLACPINRLSCHDGIQWLLGRITNSLPGVGTDRSPHLSLNTYKSTGTLSKGVNNLYRFTILYYLRSGSLLVSASLGNIKDLTIEQYFRLTQESQIPKKIDDMTIAEYLEYEETIKTQDYDEYQPHSAKADIPTKYKDHLIPRHKSPDPPLDTRTNAYLQALQSPIHPKIAKTPSKYTRENEEQSNQGLGDWFEAELEKY
ncbi:hypothetical protein Tco_1202199 [Tanacetum coccineum]